MGRYAIKQAEELEVTAPENYGSRKAKASKVKPLNTHMFYDLVR